MKNEITIVGRVLPKDNEKIHKWEVIHSIDGTLSTICSVCYKSPPLLLVIENGKRD